MYHRHSLAFYDQSSPQRTPHHAVHLTTWRFHTNRRQTSNKSSNHLFDPHSSMEIMAPRYGATGGNDNPRNPCDAPQSSKPDSEPDYSLLFKTCGRCRLLHRIVSSFFLTVMMRSADGVCIVWLGKVRRLSHLSYFDTDNHTKTCLYQMREFKGRVCLLCPQLGQYWFQRLSTGSIVGLRHIPEFSTRFAFFHWLSIICIIIDQARFCFTSLTSCRIAGAGYDQFSEQQRQIVQQALQMSPSAPPQLQAQSRPSLQAALPHQEQEFQPHVLQQEVQSSHVQVTQSPEDLEHYITTLERRNRETETALSNALFELSFHRTNNCPLFRHNYPNRSPELYFPIIGPTTFEHRCDMVATFNRYPLHNSGQVNAWWAAAAGFGSIQRQSRSQNGMWLIPTRGLGSC